MIAGRQAYALLVRKHRRINVRNIPETENDAVFLDLADAKEVARGMQDTHSAAHTPRHRVPQLPKDDDEALVECEDCSTAWRIQRVEVIG